MTESAKQPPQQLIPTELGASTLSTPPRGLQHDIVPNELFFVRNHWSDLPQLDKATYRLTVDGCIEHPLSLSLDEILSFPSETLQVMFECCGNGTVPAYWDKRPSMFSDDVYDVVGHGLVGNAEWTGVSLAAILREAGVAPSAREVVFVGADHGPDEVAGVPADVWYERALPLEKALEPEILLAHEMNGVPLPQEHGSPLRLVVPGWYGMASVKWLVGITIIDHAFTGFYHTDRYMVQNGPGADEFYTFLSEMKVKSLVTSPALGEVVPAGASYWLAGVAWSGRQEIVGVEVSVDDGRTWRPAIVHPRTDHSWHRWELDWTPSEPGDYVVRSRATNSKGESQPLEFPNPWDGRPYGNNMAFAHLVRVREVSPSSSR